MTANGWDERYRGEEYVFGKEPNAFLKQEAHRFEPGGNVLAVADGEGRNGVFLASLGLAVHAIDASSVALEKSAKLARDSGVEIELELADLSDWSWPDAQYDYVVAIFIQFADPAGRARLFEGMQRAVKPGGLVLLHGYRPEQVDLGTGGPPQREHMYTRSLLLEAFSDFEIVSLKEYDAEIHEGQGHHGLSALIDLIARRPAGDP
ncbi:MAG TPA: class I SAM-dependent methyltransferase [Pelagibacterium sp.]|uniref:SAM-dependent methyltransferase n=1 Tax=Pelagibacterium sp. TaxID=1967288 RepID=UPI002BBC72C8|nr:class I SAM-dependent methyltransferase [Pelagibacterium sp.]HWJ87706.1 class I SAM-dependent methyltransferase [Pelagibacterium sp.]